MVTELRHLLEESVQHPPAEPHDTGAILRRARTRRRRHRLVAAGSALAVVAVAGVGYGVVRELTGGTGADRWRTPNRSARSCTPTTRCPAARARTSRSSRRT